MKKNLIVRIGEGLGNQLFMYANAYSLSKKFDYNLYIDNNLVFIKINDQDHTILIFLIFLNLFVLKN